MPNMLNKIDPKLNAEFERLRRARTDAGASGQEDGAKNPSSEIGMSDLNSNIVQLDEPGKPQK